MKTEVFALDSENVTNAGNAMGQQDCHTNWTKYFSSINKAKKYAEKDYKKEKGQDQIKWSRLGRGYSSQDLGFVMYNVYHIQIEE